VEASSSHAIKPPRERASTIVDVGASVEGAALQIEFADSGDPLVASLVETSVAELAAAAMWQRQAG